MPHATRGRSWVERWSSAMPGAPSPVGAGESRPGWCPLVDVREGLQEIPVAQLVDLLRAICSRYHDRERRTVIAEGTRGYKQLRRSVVFGGTSTRISWPGLALAMLTQFDRCRRSRAHVGDSYSAMQVPPGRQERRTANHKN